MLFVIGAIAMLIVLVGFLTFLGLAFTLIKLSDWIISVVVDP